MRVKSVQKRLGVNPKAPTHRNARPESSADFPERGLNGAYKQPRALVGRTSAFIGLTLTGSPLPLRCARLSPPGHTVLRGPRLLSPLSGLPKKGNCGASNKTNPKQHTGVVHLPSPPGEGDRGWGL